jgi:hypothetical protein
LAALLLLKINIFVYYNKEGNMPLRFSTCLRNKLLGGVPARHVATITGTTIAAVDGGASPDSFTDSANGFVAAGFEPGDSIMVYGFTGGMAAIHGPFTILTVAVGEITVATGLLAADAASESVTIVCLTGGSLKDVFKDGILKIYSGSQPTSPDDAYNGALLVSITISSGAFVSGVVTNGIEFGDPASAAIAKRSGDVWSGIVASTGIAAWFRFYANGVDAGGADTGFVYPRIDGTIGVSGAQLNMSSTSLVAGTTITIDSFELSIPASF